MNDPYLSQGWAEHHAVLGNWVASLFDSARHAFERLAARNYDAPWNTGDAPPKRRLSLLNWR